MKCYSFFNVLSVNHSLVVISISSWMLDKDAFCSILASSINCSVRIVSRSHRVDKEGCHIISFPTPSFSARSLRIHDLFIHGTL